MPNARNEAPHPPYPQINCELIAAGRARAVAVSSVAPNKANFPCSGPENEDRVEKQSQFHPAGAGVATSLTGLAYIAGVLLLAAARLQKL